MSLSFIKCDTHKTPPMTDAIKTTPPEMTVGDLAHIAARTIISGIPGAGGPLKEFFSALVTPPLIKRRDEWVQSIAEGLVALQEKVHGFSFESLQNNEAFITIVMNATQVAVRTHQREKIEALRNAVLNVAGGNAPQEDLQLMFLGFIDSLTQWHLRLLRFYQGVRVYGGGPNIPYPLKILEHAFPDLRGQQEFYQQILRDLFARGLIDTESPPEFKSPPAAFNKGTTDIGDQFLEFISPPLKQANP